MDAITWAILNAFGSVKKVATKPQEQGGMGMSEQEFKKEVSKQTTDSFKNTIGRAIPWAKYIKWALLGLATFYVFRITKK